MHVSDQKVFLSEESGVICLPAPGQRLGLALVQGSFLREPRSLLCPLRTQVRCCPKILTTPPTDTGVTGLSVRGRRIGVPKCSLFFGSQKTVSFQALLMDSFIMFGSKYSLSHDTTLPYVPSVNDDLQGNQRISELEGTFHLRARNVFSSPFDLSIQPPLEYHQ